MYIKIKLFIISFPPQLLVSEIFCHGHGSSDRAVATSKVIINIIVIITQKLVQLQTEIQGFSLDLTVYLWNKSCLSQKGLHLYGREEHTVQVLESVMEGPGSGRWHKTRRNDYIKGRKAKPL